MDFALFKRTGGTRTVLQADHAFIAPDGHVLTPLTAWGGAMGVIQISPAMGARLAQTLVFLESQTVAFTPSPGIEAFVYVLEGRLKTGDTPLETGNFIFIPPGEQVEVSTDTSARLVVFEKRYASHKSVATPQLTIGHERDYEGKPFMGDPDATLQVLLPETAAFDMAVNIFTYQAGATLPFVETHIMEHGLLMLDGMGIYRLDERWYPVAAGDCIWMAPYCPQWFGALGKTPSRYIYYKNINRDAMEAL